MTDRTGATLVRCEKCKMLHEPLDPCPTPKVEAATDEAIAAHRERMCDMEIEDLVPEDQEYLRLIARIDAQGEQITRLQESITKEVENAVRLSPDAFDPVVLAAARDAVGKKASEEGTVEFLNTQILELRGQRAALNDRVKTLEQEAGNFKTDRDKWREKSERWREGVKNWEDQRFRLDADHRATIKTMDAEIVKWKEKAQAAWEEDAAVQLALNADPEEATSDEATRVAHQRDTALRRIKEL